MKKILTTIAIVTLAALCLVYSLQLAYNKGLEHALFDSELWIMETGDDPDVYIWLDGDWYLHAGYTG
jgi:hypothetical protein